MNALIDWLQFTFIPTVNEDSEDVTPESLISDLLCISPAYFKIRKGLYYYKSGIEYENISVFYDGMTEGMGVHFQLSGKGCRFIETQANFDWKMFLTSLIAHGCKFTRIDIAIDDDKYLDLNEIRKSLDEERVVTKFRDYSKTEQRSFKGNRIKGNGILFGTKSSDTYMRVYDKNLESNGSIQAIRWETVLKQTRAHNFVLEYIKPESFGNLSLLAGQVINNYIRFIDEKKNNISRSLTSQWWSDFIETTKKLSLGKGKEEVSLEKVQNWYERQVASGVKLLVETKGLAYVENVLYRSHLNNKHRRIKDNYNRQKRELEL